MSSEAPVDYKQHIVKWIEEDAIQATKRGSKMAVLYNKILGQVRRFQEPISDTRTLKSIKYVGVKTAESLRNRIIQLCNDNGWEPPRGFLDEVESHRKALQNVDSVAESMVQDQGQGPAKKKARNTANYVPKHRSGAFAILITLYLKDRDGHGMTRDQITAVASLYCDKTFAVSSTAFHSAWDSIKTLLKKELVYSTGRSPKYYFLTDEGFVLAKQLKGAVDLDSSPAQSQTIANTSYDNGVRLDSTFENSSPTSYKNLNLDIDISSNPTAGGASSLQRPHNPAHNNRLILETLSKKAVHDATNRNYDGTRYEIWTEEEYEVVLYIDNREIRSKQERDFFQRKLETAGVKCEAKSLSCGDALWVARNLRSGREAILNYLCERKRIDDLCDSIKDGRFQEQKNRMKKSGISHCFYLVEDSANVRDQVFSIIDAIQTGIAQTMTNANIYVRRFKNIDETTDFLASLTKTIEERTSNTNLIILKPRDIPNQAQYNQLLTTFREKFEQRPKNECCHLFSSFQDMMGKTTQMTVKELFVLMLMTIKGCSLEKAIVIQNRFPTPKKLIEYYQIQHGHASVECKKKLLAEEFKSQVGNKKVGKVLSEKVYDIWGS
ncbi:MUS81 [Candida oxycetoniae]|uniref:Crossover junction endonuclease MUS81 n=1 Tax=Candida oxycetoniae TaxID=497107 RepID=A0AAI9T273_9ASCO|nr:MUS81 [Candida oxycetoniae]KAI3407109.2 MUS81 [Candida oxycetoniae]